MNPEFKYANPEQLKVGDTVEYQGAFVLYGRVTEVKPSNLCEVTFTADFVVTQTAFTVFLKPEQLKKVD